MFRSSVRLLAWVREPGLGLRLWHGLAATTAGEVELTLARGPADLRDRARRSPPHLLLLDVVPLSAEDPLARVRIALDAAPQAAVLLCGRGTSELHARLGELGAGRSRVVLLEDLGTVDAAEDLVQASS